MNNVIIISVMYKSFRFAIDVLVTQTIIMLLVITLMNYRGIESYFYVINKFCTRWLREPKYKQNQEILYPFVSLSSFSVFLLRNISEVNLLLKFLSLSSIRILSQSNSYLCCNLCVIITM